MSDTPRTDALLNNKEVVVDCAFLDFARQLERELLSAQCKAKDSIKDATPLMNRICELTDESAERDKAMMLLYGEMVKYRTKNFALMALSKINDNQVNSFIRIVEAAEQRNKK
jgi:hypothetical protein